MRRSSSGTISYRPFCSARTGSARAAAVAGEHRGEHARRHSGGNRAGHHQGFYTARRLAGDSVQCFERFGNVAGSQPGKSGAQDDARQGAGQPDATTFKEKEGADLRSRGAQRAQNADLSAALRDGHHQGVLNQEQSDDQGEDTGEAGRAAVIHQHLLEIAAPLGGRIDVEAGAEGRGQSAPAIVHRNSAPRGDIDPVEFALLSENSLRRVDVHHRQAAAKSLGQSSRTEQAAHGKEPGAFHRFQNQPAAHGKAVTGGKIAARA